MNDDGSMSVDKKGWTDKTRRTKVDKHWTKLWWMIMNANVDGTMMDGRRRWHYNVIRIRKLCSNGMKKKRKNFFSFISCFFLLLFLIFFFTFSMILAACSFDHWCRKPGEMEIDKWSLKKGRKPNVYWSKVLLANLHEELEQQSS